MIKLLLVLLSGCIPLVSSCDKSESVYYDIPDIPIGLKDIVIHFALGNNMGISFEKDMFVFSYNDNSHFLNDSASYEQTVINALSKRIVEEVYAQYYYLFNADHLLVNYSIDINTTFCIKVHGVNVNDNDVNYVFFKDISEYSQWK
jgi:hypothetical protein